jgi:Rrf2 family transcriptional regulator, iron-sulfur cluster assembly transcription factor
MGLQLTRGAEYAIRAMTYLARYPEGHVASLHEIGEAQDIPESFLAKILQSLVRAGLTVSQRGAHGGFALARPASEITMQQVIEAVDGPISVNQCVLSPEDCARSASCTVHEAWLRAQGQLMDVLGSITLESLAPAPAAVG